MNEKDMNDFLVVKVCSEGYVNKGFESTESNDLERPALSEETDEDELQVSQRSIIPNFARSCRIRSSFSYLRLKKNQRTRCQGFKIKKTSKLGSYLVKKIQKNHAKNFSRRLQKLNAAPKNITSEITSTKNVEFILPVILVTDTTSMNTIIIDLDEF